MKRGTLVLAIATVSVAAVALAKPMEKVVKLQHHSVVSLLLAKQSNNLHLPKGVTVKGKPKSGEVTLTGQREDVNQGLEMISAWDASRGLCVNISVSTNGEDPKTIERQSQSDLAEVIPLANIGHGARILVVPKEDDGKLMATLKLQLGSATYSLPVELHADTEIGFGTRGGKATLMVIDREDGVPKSINSFDLDDDTWNCLAGTTLGIKISQVTLIDERTQIRD